MNHLLKAQTKVIIEGFFLNNYTFRLSIFVCCRHLMVLVTWHCLIILLISVCLTFCIVVLTLFAQSLLFGMSVFFLLSYLFNTFYKYVFKLCVIGFIHFNMLLYIFGGGFLFFGIFVRLTFIDYLRIQIFALIAIR